MIQRIEVSDVKRLIETFDTEVQSTLDFAEVLTDKMAISEHEKQRLRAFIVDDLTIQDLNKMMDLLRNNSATLPLVVPMMKDAAKQILEEKDENQP